MVNTKPIITPLFKNHLQKAQESLISAQDALARGHWNSCVIAAIHSAISAADALTIYHLGQRCLGERHTEVLSLIKQIKAVQGTDINKKIQQFSSLIDLKNQAEYEEKLMSPTEAELALKHAERFLDWVKRLTASSPS